jgi:hypothetical protein
MVSVELTPVNFLCLTDAGVLIEAGECVLPEGRRPDLAEAGVPGADSSSPVKSLKGFALTSLSAAGGGSTPAPHPIELLYAKLL